MKLWSAIASKPSSEKENTITESALTHSIVISVASVIVCMLCLIGATWAWYTTTLTSSQNKITAATYNLNISVTQNDSADAAAKDGSGYYLLDPAKTYTVTLTKSGTAKTGFCHLSVVPAQNDTATAYYTDSIPTQNAAKNGTYVFTVSGVVKIKFTPMWGDCPDEADKVVHYNDTLAFAYVSEAPPEETTAEAPEETTEPPAQEPIAEPPSETLTETEDTTPEQEPPTNDTEPAEMQSDDTNASPEE